jgi:hypothetical protein
MLPERSAPTTRLWPPRRTALSLYRSSTPDSAANSRRFSVLFPASGSSGSALPASSISAQSWRSCSRSFRSSYPSASPYTRCDSISRTLCRTRPCSRPSRKQSLNRPNRWIRRSTSRSNSPPTLELIFPSSKRVITDRYHAPANSKVDWVHSVASTRAVFLFANWCVENSVMPEITALCQLVVRYPGQNRQTGIAGRGRLVRHSSRWQYHFEYRDLEQIGLSGRPIIDPAS